MDQSIINALAISGGLWMFVTVAWTFCDALNSDKYKMKLGDNILIWIIIAVFLFIICEVWIV